MKKVLAGVALSGMMFWSASALAYGGFNGNGWNSLTENALTVNAISANGWTNGVNLHSLTSNATTDQDIVLNVKTADAKTATPLPVEVVKLPR